MHYRAFISHSHADARFAAWLQRAIETWRVPSQLRDELGYTRIRPVFRDRSDLRAASSLGKVIEDALACSDALIVVCSNQAAESEWVIREISRYRALNPDGMILPVIAGGEPPHCFPRTLLRDADGNVQEPSAADARKGFDGRRDALLKTIAGLLDVEFDTLKRRDFRRRQQKLSAVAALATGVAAFTLYLAYMAYEARDDASHRREQADDLIAFMLGDLRARLEPIGKLDVLDAVGEKAIEYFSELEGDEITPEVTLNHAIAMRQIGEVHMAQGDYAAALETFELSLSALQRIAGSRGLRETVLFELAQSHFWVGYVHLEQRALPLARASFLAYLDLTRQLVGIDGDSATYRSELGYALMNLGVLELEAEQFTAANEYFRQALPVFDAATHSANRIERLDQMSKLHSWIGESAYRSGNLVEAAESYREEYRLLRICVEETDDMRFPELLANASRRLAITLMLLGGDSYLEHTRTALDQSRQLVEFDPTHFYWRWSFASAAVAHSQALAFTGQWETAMETMAEALPVLAPLCDTEDPSVQSLGVCADAAAQRARLLRFSGQYEDALRLLDHSLELIRRQADLSGKPELASSLARLYLLEGDLEAEVGAASEARASWAEALPLTEPDLLILESPIDLMTRAALMERLDRPADARSVREELYGMGVSRDSEKLLTAAFVDGRF